MDTEKYTKGYNHGYLLKKYKPKLLESILKSPEKNDYFQGLKDGGKQLEKENTKTLSRLQQLKNLENSRDKNYDQQIDL